MTNRLVQKVQPFLIKNGKPTNITKMLLKTKEGRRLIEAMFAYYVSVSKQKTIPASSLDLSINIEDYRLGKG